VRRGRERARETEKAGESDGSTGEIERKRDSVWNGPDYVHIH